MPKPVFDRSIVQDLIDENSGDQNINRSIYRTLLAILVELRIANGRSGDSGDNKVRKGAESALKTLSNLRV